MSVPKKGGTVLASPRFPMGSHVFSQRRIDLGLILAPKRSEPGQQISIEPQCDLLLDRAVEVTAYGATEVFNSFQERGKGTHLFPLRGASVRDVWTK